jgi:hypothetical protein
VRLFFDVDNYADEDRCEEIIIKTVNQLLGKDGTKFIYPHILKSNGNKKSMHIYFNVMVPTQYAKYIAKKLSEVM